MQATIRRRPADRSRIARNGWLTTALGIRLATGDSTQNPGFPPSNQASVHDWRAKLDRQGSGIDDVMMPVSHRVGAAVATKPVNAGNRARTRSANSSTFAIVGAATFALLSAFVSLIPDAAPQPLADDLVLAPLRGSLPTISEAARP
jgi:hypothetical protein